MRLTTQVWIKLESVGQPRFTIKKQVTIREAALTIGQWLVEVEMGSKLRICLGRRESDVDAGFAQAQTVADMSAELTALLGDDFGSDED